MTKPWANGPYTLLATPSEDLAKKVGKNALSLYLQTTNDTQYSKEAIWVATDMSLAHNILLLNLNSIYLQCEQVVEPADIADFLIYCQCSIEEIHTHHDLEELHLFPEIVAYSGEKDIMTINLEQHHAFEASLTTLEKYLTETTPQTYVGTELKKLVEVFADELVPHLTDEIVTLLELDKFGGEKLGKLWTEFNEKILPSIKDKVRLLLTFSTSFNL